MNINEELAIIKEVREAYAGREYPHDRNFPAWERGRQQACDEIEARLLAPFENRTLIKADEPIWNPDEDRR